MNLYEETIQKELQKWHINMKRKPSIANKISKSIQTKTQSFIPKRIQNLLTESIKGITEAIMFGSGLLNSSKTDKELSLSESDYLVENAFKIYQKTAIVQGVGFGAGGILLGLADFPALLTIKVKFLFDCLKYYGYDMNDKRERLYLLYVFQLAFSSDEHRLKIYHIIINWDSERINPDEFNWEKFQTEYRDYIDIAKMLQLLPVVGAVAGGVANFKLLEKLKITAMNCFRLRYLSTNIKNE